jgi:polyketide cyclase/dehydrase/lipid transport protein
MVHDAPREVPGMAKEEASIHIERPPEEVFAFVGDAANNPTWRKNVVRTEWLDDGPMRVGRRGRQTARLLGREWTVEAEIVEWDPPRSATFRTVQGPVTVRSWYRVAPDGTGSLVTGGGDGGFTGPLGGLLTRLAAPRMVKQAEIDLRTLRDRLEAEG